MPYDEEELEKKLKTAKNFWSFAFAKYCRQQELEAEKAWEDAYRNLVEAFSPQKDRIAKAAEILKAATQIHDDIKAISEERAATREELEKIKEESIDERAEKISKGIGDYCEKFTTNRDRTAIARDGSCLLEYLNAMNEDPELAAKVGLNDAQMNAASKIVTMAMIIKEGMEALEQEYVDSTQPEHSISPKQHEMNITKIACMDLINEKRFNGNLVKELQNCKLLKKQTAEDRLDTAAVMADPERRRRMTKAFADSVTSHVKQASPI